MSTTSFPWTPLLFALLIAAFVYAARRVKRTRAEQRARSDERAAELLRAMHQETARARDTAPGKSATGRAEAPVRQQAPAAPTVPATLARRPRLLADHQHLLYLLLRAALPEHVVMVNIRIADLAESYAEHSARQDFVTRMRQLSQERADCVVCNNDLVPLAALVVYEGGIANVPDERIKVEALRELGIRFLRFRADSLPRPGEMRALILG